MTATFTTAALLLVPFLVVVGVGAVAVAIHDAIARAWADRRTPQRSGASAAAARRSSALRGATRRCTPAILARSGSTPRGPARRARSVLVR